MKGPQRFTQFLLILKSCLLCDGDNDDKEKELVIKISIIQLSVYLVHVNICNFVFIKYVHD